MEREIEALSSVLGQIKNDAGFAILAGVPPDSVRLVTQLYNEVLARLGALSPEIRACFRPLPEEASAANLRMSSRSLLGYLGDTERI